MTSKKRRNKTLLIFLLSVFFLSTALGGWLLIPDNVTELERDVSVTSLAQDWQTILDQFNITRDIKINSSGDLIIAGAALGPGVGYDLMVAKVNSTGHLKWNATWDYNNSDDEAHGVALNGTDLFVVGYGTSGSIVRLIVLKYNSSSQLEWSTAWQKTGFVENYGYDIAINGSSIFVVGFVQKNGSYLTRDALLLKLDSAGNELWNVTFTGPTDQADHFFALALAGDSIYAVGESNSYGMSPGNALLVRYSQSTGAQVGGFKAWGGASGNSDGAQDIVIDSSNFIYVTGYYTGSDGTETLFLNKYNPDATFTSVWLKSFSIATTNCGGTGLAIINDTSLYVAGASYTSPTVGDALVVKYGADGAFLGHGTWDGPSSLADVAYAIAVDTAGNTYFAGDTMDEPGTYDAYLVKNLQLTPPSGDGGIPGFQSLFLVFGLIAIVSLYFLRTKRLQI